MTTEPEVLDPSTVANDATANHSNNEPIPVTDPTAVKENDTDLSPSELKDLQIARLMDELAAMKKDKASSVTLAEEAEAARRDWEDLKSRTKTAKDRYDQSLEALSKQVRGEVQTEIDAEEDADQETIPFTAAPEQTMAELDAITIDGLDWTAVEQSALSALVSTGKPAKVKPVEIMGLDYVLVDVQKRVAIFHQVMDGETFTQTHGLDGAERPDERSEGLQRLGSVAGVPVRVGRKTLWLGANPLCVVIPPSAAISATTSDDGPNPVGNRIVAHLKSSGVEQITVDALAKLLGVERDIVQRTASEDGRLVYEIDGELVLLA
jgi:hypothetical protein